MNEAHDDIQRNMLLGASIRFSSSGASVRSQAIRRIVEQQLASAEGAAGLLESQIQRLKSCGREIAVLRSSDVREGLNSLAQEGRILTFGPPQRTRYTLSEEAKKETMEALADSQKRMDACVRDLFTGALGGAERYKGAFLTSLCLVFSRLSEVYVQLIAVHKDGRSIVENSLLSATVDEVLRVTSVPDAKAFRNGVMRFFRESSPQFDHIKWNMSQNFYVAKALGIEEAADLLSVDIFKGASLYCDTNVLIAGLTPENRYQQSLRELAKACERIGMTLKATHVTVAELRSVILVHGTLLKKVLHSIPDDTLPNVRNFLLEAFLVERKTSPTLSVEDFMGRYQKPLDTLRASFGLCEEDDKWFDEVAQDNDTRQLATELAKAYEDLRGRRKPPRAALHDALLLRWAARENEQGRKACVVTLDLSLVRWNAGSETIKVTTLDALLQWMTPVAFELADEDTLAAIFADAIRYQLLPRETFFQLVDFQVFADMGIDTKALPAEDVEACIREIRHAGLRLDPSKAEDREKLGQIIQRHFADPGTKYKRTLLESRALSETLAEELAKERGRREHAEKCADKLAKEANAKQSDLESAESRIQQLEQLAREQEEAAHCERLKVSALRGAAIAVAALVVIEIIIGLYAWLFGEGQNLFQKLTNAWVWLGAGVAVVAIPFRFLMGKERMRLLWWWKRDAD